MNFRPGEWKVFGGRRQKSNLVMWGIIAKGKIIQSATLMSKTSSKELGLRQLLELSALEERKNWVDVLFCWISTSSYVFSVYWGKQINSLFDIQA